MCQKRLLSHIMPGETTCIQCSVNMDAFMGGATPEILWGNDGADDRLSKDYSKEASDIFPTAMENNFLVGSTIIDAVLQGSF